VAKISHVRGAFRGSPNVFIAVPSYTGKVDNGLLESLLHSIPKLQAAGIGFEFFMLSYNCHVDDGRNAIVRDFLRSKCDQLVFIDADVSWAPGTLLKLIQHDRDVVAGVYPKRTLHDQKFPVLVEPGKDLQADADGLVEVAGAPTGFMKIKRQVLEKFVEANKHRQYRSAGDDPSIPPYTLIFERELAEGQRYSGDYNFCRLWRKMGGKIFVDPEMFLTHTGEVEFEGTLGDYWRKEHGIDKAETKAKFNEAILDLRSGNPRPESFLNLVKGWDNPFSAKEELLAACYYVVQSLKPQDGAILETGCGLSTIVMALANPDIQIHALEHEPVWASAIKYALESYDIRNVTVHFEKLKQYDDGRWYDTSTLPKENFALALCDGPPRRISNRNLLWKNLGDQLASAVVLMDDADDDEATQPMRDWAKNLGRKVKILGSQRHFAVSPLGATV
jgi:predicted O-methyltransferase YrrM